MVSAPVVAAQPKQPVKNNRRVGVKILAAPVSMIAALAIGSMGFTSNASMAYVEPETADEAVVTVARDGAGLSRSRVGQSAVRSARTSSQLNVPKLPETDETLVQALEPESKIALASTTVTKQAIAEEKARKAKALAEKRRKEREAAELRRYMSKSGYVRPAAGSITSPFGYRIHPILGYSKFHNGVDIANPCGTPIRAMESGVVTANSYQGGYGNRVVVKHNNGLISGYAHLSYGSVSVGQHVKKGQVVGAMGTTGMSTGCHLHFTIEEGAENFVDPLKYI